MSSVGSLMSSVCIRLTMLMLYFVHSLETNFFPWKLSFLFYSQSAQIRNQAMIIFLDLLSPPPPQKKKLQAWQRYSLSLYLRNNWKNIVVFLFVKSRPFLFLPLKSEIQKYIIFSLQNKNIVIRRMFKGYRWESGK